MAMKAMPATDQAVYTTSTSKPALPCVRAKESKIRLSPEKTTIASTGVRFENPCESFKEVVPATSGYSHEKGAR
jgi:hypothetical protein